MCTVTMEGKEAALAALAQRREANKSIEHINNARLPAGSDMYFYCITCGEEMSFPENYINRSKLCEFCQELKEAGWLE